MFSDFPLPDPDRPVLIAGPTASGKSALALKIAQAQGRAVVNADALQVHAPWRVLTARPDPFDEGLAPHHLYGHVPMGAEYSVGHWLREVTPLVALNPVIVGGTGLYFTALTQGLAEIPSTPPEIRAEADARLHPCNGDPLDALAAMVDELDPETAARIDKRNPARVQRAWEVLRATGRGLAEWQAETGAPVLPREAATALVLKPRIDWLNERIVRRFETMVQQGALDEARAAYPHWPEDGGTPSGPLWTKAIGAPELMAYLAHRMTLEKAKESASLSTRQYAKRQRSWFRSRMSTWDPVVIP
ncbi:tRNA (adenosine(37)-N6)-dimethylallyltransferase MiaA [Pararhodobacter marinus]|uniref:tRNA (adenosine(37)-N6)-dimethylallyltransferase MiaA n=1 Tax=Pararhodobacter marinus TaxID=2184063 RepID=UPI0035184F39